MLKILILKRQLDAKRSELKALEEKDAEFQTREADLETAIGEVLQVRATAGREAAVTAEVDAFEADKTAHETAKQTRSADIEHRETELADLERQAPATKTPEKREKVRGDVHMETQINIRSLPMGRRAFDALPMEQRQAIVAQPEVQEFLSKMRGMKGQNRAVTGAELTIPVVFLDLISENMYRYSKLLNRVRVRNVRGEARQTIAGIVPEAVWTEMCGAINELTFVFGQVTLDGYKVAGFIPVCNSMLEDSDIELASSIVEMLSESVGLAEDKAILYGKGAASKMPLGIVTRLAQTSQPSDYPANAPAWVDLHTTNILKIGGRGVSRAGGWGWDQRCHRGGVLGAADGGHRRHPHKIQPRQFVLGHELQDLYHPEIQGDHLHRHRRYRIQYLRRAAHHHRRRGYPGVYAGWRHRGRLRRPVPVVPALRHDH